MFSFDAERTEFDTITLTLTVTVYDDILYCLMTQEVLVFTVRRLSI